MSHLVCEFCGSTYKTVSALNQHKKISKKCLKLRGIFTGYKCNICEKVFSTSAYLENHKLSCVKRAEIIVVQMSRDEYDWYISNKPLTSTVPFDLDKFCKEVTISISLQELASLELLTRFLKPFLRGITVTSNDVKVLLGDTMTSFNKEEFVVYLFRSIKDIVDGVLNRSDHISDSVWDTRKYIGYIATEFPLQKGIKGTSRAAEEISLAEKQIQEILNILRSS